jgi:hypothetical protein
MRFSINTRDEGKLEFWAPDNGGYIRLESPNNSGTLGQQICDGGRFMGNTLSAGSSLESLARVARAWRKQQLASRVTY